MLAVCDTTPEDVLLSWLPYSHVYARTVDHYSNILAAATVALAESQETLLANLAEIQPTWITAVPRFYEKVWSAVCQAPAEIRAAQLKKIFGPRIRWLSSGGAPLPRHVADGFIAVGIPLLEGYGLTESSPVISFNRLDSYRIGTVGQAIPGVEVRIADDGEILTRGPHVMRGYWKEPQATAATVIDGWLHTGDVGQLDADGFLTITDRKKDLIITSGGKNIAPSELERLLTADPYIDQAVVCGDRRPFVAALVVPNLARLAEKAAELGGSMTATDGLLQDPAIVAFMAERIEAVMQPLSQPERVKKFLLLARAFQAEAGELTATLKVRRRHILEVHAERIDALYAECG
jgi:long-chain acyl-CoA synthetase